MPGIKTLYFYSQFGCDVCAEAKPHVEAFKKDNLLRVFVIHVDASRNIVSMADIDPKSTPAYALLDESFQPVKTHEGLLTRAQIDEFVYGKLGKQVKAKR